MNLTDYIKQGEDALTTGKALAERLGLTPPDLSAAKHGRRGLPPYACVKLAQLIGEDPTRVIAASELVTETREERRAVWLPFVIETVTTAQTKTARTVEGFARARSFT